MNNLKSRPVGYKTFMILLPVSLVYCVQLLRCSIDSSMIVMITNEEGTPLHVVTLAGRVRNSSGTH